MRQLDLGKSSKGKPKTGVDMYLETPKELWNLKTGLLKILYNLVEM